MTKKDSINFKLTTPDLVTLSLLSEYPMHGYDINQELERRDVKDWAGISRAQVYYSLKKLQSLKMIIEINDLKQSEGPDRQIYKITSKGKQGLTESLNNENWALQRSIPPFLTWMALSIHATPTSVAHLIHKRQAFLEKEIKREKETLQSFKTESGKTVKAAILMVKLTIEQFKIELKWLQKVKKSLLD